MHKRILYWNDNVFYFILQCYNFNYRDVSDFWLNLSLAIWIFVAIFEWTCWPTHLSGNASNISPCNIMLAVGLLYIALIVLRNVPSIANFVKCFLYIYKHMVLFSSFLMWNTCIYLHVSNHSCTLEINPGWYRSILDSVN